MAKKKHKAALATPDGVKVISVNKKARHDYEILETFEAGLVLTGSEIKSIRAGKVNLREAYVRPQAAELWLIGAHISEYSHSSEREYNPTRSRKLLMHTREILRLQGRVEMKGHTIVPLKIYLKRGFAKLEVALARGKHAPDKRAAIKEREQKLEAERALKRG